MLKFQPQPHTALGQLYAADANAHGYSACTQDGRICGSIIFYVDGYSMRIVDARAEDDDDETYEGLIRSALHYGGNRGAYIAEYTAQNARNIALALGFAPQGDKLAGEIPFLLQGRCCKEKE